MIKPILFVSLLGVAQVGASAVIESHGSVARQTVHTDVPECPSKTKLCLVPIDLYHVEPSGDLTLQTNNGSNMLLQLENQSNTNIVTLMVRCGAVDEQVELGVYSPDNLRRYNRDWGGCLMEIVNVTKETAPADALIFLVGQ